MLSFSIVIGPVDEIIDVKDVGFASTAELKSRRGKTTMRISELVYPSNYLQHHDS